MKSAIKKEAVAGACKEALGLFLILLIPFLPNLITVLSLSYLSYNNSSDTFLYLDIARNFLEGRGLVSSFNVYQYWTGLYYPALPFVHVVYSLFLSVFYFFFPAVQKLVLLNFILAFFNFYLIYRIVKKIYDDRALAAWVACLVAAMVSTQITLLRLLTEQLSLLVTLSAVFLFIASAEYPAICSGDIPLRRDPLRRKGVGNDAGNKNSKDTLRLAAESFISKKELSRRDLTWIGLILGFGFLVRSSAIIYPLCFFFALLLARKDDLSMRLHSYLLLFWPLLIVGAYSGFIFFRYGVFFPEYPQAFKNYYLATFTTGGDFFSRVPAIRPYLGNFLGFYYGINFLDMLRVLFCEVRVLIIFGLIRMVYVFKKRQRGELLFCGLVLLPIVATILIYPYMRVAEFQWTRFLLLPVIFLSALGVKAWRDFTQKFFSRIGKFLFHAVLGIILVSNFYQSCRVLEVYWQKSERSDSVSSLSALVKWSTENTKKEDLIAVSMYLMGRVDLERPTVILPLYKMLTKENLKNFIVIYKPRALIFERTLPDVLRQDLKKNGYDLCPFFGTDSLFIIFEPARLVSANWQR